MFFKEMLLINILIEGLIKKFNQTYKNFIQQRDNNNNDKITYLNKFNYQNNI